MSAVDTAKVVEYRKLRFNSIDELQREIGRIVEADQRGKLRRSGNWTTGQVFGHLASWINYGYDGFPMKPPPFFIRWIIKLQKKKWLRDGMPRGVKVPGSKDGTWGTDEMSTHEGAERLREALGKLKSGQPATHHSPAFGPMSLEDRVQLQLRHAEEHLGYLHY